MRIVIVDDQKKVRTSIRGHIETHYPQATVIKEANDITSALEVIRNDAPDVVLLDIKMPEGSGFDLLKQLMPLKFKLIFITAYEEYAVQAFKFSALDFLLKPIDPTELVNALQKASFQLQQDELNSKLNNFIYNMTEASRDIKKLVIKSKEALRVVSINDIIRCEADDNYTRFFLKDGKTIIASETLKIYDDLLSSAGFFRSHHSHLINTEHIETFERNKGVLIMSDKAEVPVSVRKKDHLLELLQNI
jgi:two-component system LytT family response regulator